MPDFDDINQVIKFVAQLDPQSAQKLTSELNKLNAERVDAVMSSETKIQDIQSKALQQRLALAVKELDELESQLVSKTDREIEQIKRVMEANEARYKFVVDKHREASQAQQDLSKALSDKELEQYKTFLMNKDSLHKRQAEVEKERNQEGGGIGAGIAGVAGAVGKGVGAITGMLPANTEQEKQTKLMGETASNVLQSKTPMEALVNVVKGAIQMWDLARREDARRGSEALTSMGGTNLWKGGEFNTGDKNYEEFKRSMKWLEEKLPEKFRGEAPKVLEAMLTSNRSAGQGTQGDLSHIELNKRFIELSTTATLLGKNWTDFAKTTGELARKEGVTIDQALGGIHVAMATAQKISAETGTGGIDIRKFMENVVTASDALRPFGFTMRDATGLVSKFAKELDTGVISLGDLVSWATGITKTEDSSKAFLFQQMQRQLGGKTEFGELGQVMGAVGKSPLEQGRALEALSQGNVEALKALGLKEDVITKAIGQFQQGIQITAKEYSKALGGGTEFARQANEDFFRRQFVDKDLIGSGTQGMTIAARTAIRDKGFGGEAPLVEGEKARLALEGQRDQIAKTIVEIREDQKGIVARTIQDVKAGQGGYQAPNLTTGTATPGGGGPQIAVPGSNKFNFSAFQYGVLEDDIAKMERDPAGALKGIQADLAKAKRNSAGQIPAEDIFQNYRQLASPDVLQKFPELIKSVDPAVLKYEATDDASKGRKEHLQRILEAGQPVAALDVNVNVGGDINNPGFQDGLKNAVASYVKDYMQKEQDDPITRATKKLQTDFTNQSGTSSIG